MLVKFILLCVTDLNESSILQFRFIFSGSAGSPRYDGLVLRYDWNTPFVAPASRLPSPLDRSRTGELPCYTEDVLAHALVCSTLPKALAYLSVCMCVAVSACVSSCLCARHFLFVFLLATSGETEVPSNITIYLLEYADIDLRDIRVLLSCCYFIFERFGSGC